MTKGLTCIECPKGCPLSVDIEEGKVRNVQGAKCPKGVGYAISEIESPARIFTSTVLAEGLTLKLVPVRTDKPIPRGDIFRAAEETRNMRITKPIASGDVIMEDFMGLGVKLVATRAALADAGRR